MVKRSSTARNTATQNTSTGKKLNAASAANLLILIARLSRHVIVPQKVARLVPKNHLMTETEWRNLGIQQSPGKTTFIDY